MRFGLFGGNAARNIVDASDPQSYRQFVDYVCEAEDLGFHSVFLVEHHFTGINQISASLNVLAYLAARTTRLRLGTAVVVMPWHNPALLAEQAATVDVLSDGRLDFGVGRGYRWSEFAGFCMPLDEAGERYEEALDFVRKAWTAAGRFSHHGPRWRYENIVIEPSPVQRPHPPLWVGANSAESIRRAGEAGFNLLLDQLGSVEKSIERVATYREAVERRGRAFEPMSIGLTRALCVALNREEREQAYRNRAKFLVTVQALSRAPSGPGSHVHLPATEAENRAMTDASALIGPPEEIITRLRQLEAGGVRYVLLMDVACSREALRIFAREVMPEFAEPPRRAARA